MVKVCESDHFSGGRVGSDWGSARRLYFEYSFAVLSILFTVLNSFLSFLETLKTPTLQPGFHRSIEPIWHVVDAMLHYCCERLL